MGTSDKDLDEIATEIVEVAEEIDSVFMERASLEDIEGAKTKTGIILDKYANLMKQLDRTDQKKLEQSVGPGIERIKKGLRLLKEAPE